MGIIRFLIISVFALFLVFDYMIILGASMLKTDEERIFEDEEQIAYLREYRIRKMNKKLRI